ncbi:MAG: 30S ribosomal protein S6 [Verrucomicrobiota bacterium]
MKKYEGLFILNTAGKEDAVKDLIDKVAAELTAAGGKVETIQKMEKRPFARVANKKESSGFYVNIIFEIPPAAIAAVRSRFAMNEDILRTMITIMPKPKETAPVAA